MDIFGLIGLFLAVALCIFGIIQGGGDIMAFVSVPSLMIVLGGTIGSLMIATPFETIRNVPKHLKIVFSKSPYIPQEYINQIVELAKVARRNGLLALEEKANDITDDFLKGSVMLIVDAIEPDRVQRILETQIDYIQQRHDEVTSFYDQAAALGPAFGMLGTVIGLINMLGDLSLADPEILGVGMAVALITTLYGSFLANVLFSPISAKLNAIGNQEMLCLRLSMEGIISIQAGENPKHIESKLMSYLPAEMQTVMDNPANDQRGV